MIPSLAQVCTLPADFAEDVEQYAAGKCPAIEFWLTKLEQYVEKNGLEQVVQLLQTHEIKGPVASFQGGLFQPENLGFQDAWDLFSSRLELCGSLGVETIVVAGDIVDPLTQPLIDRVTDRLRKIAEFAAQKSQRVAFEFQASATFANNLETAAALVADLGHPALGLCLDAFHFHVGPSKTEDLRLLTTENLFHVQLSDLADTARELASDRDRILPGEGDIAIERIVEIIKMIGYSAYVSVETINPQLWQVPPRQFGEIATTALRKALGMGANQG